MRLHRQWKRAISFLTSVVLTTVSIVPGISPMTAYAAGEDPSKVYVVGSDPATELNESLPSMYDAGTYTAKYIEDGSEEHYAKKKFEWTDKNAGEGKITIETKLPVDSNPTTAVYAFTTCTGHGFGSDYDAHHTHHTTPPIYKDIAKANIEWLLKNYDQVDLIIVDQGNYGGIHIKENVTLANYESALEESRSNFTYGHHWNCSLYTGLYEYLFKETITANNYTNLNKEQKRFPTAIYVSFDNFYNGMPGAKDNQHGIAVEAQNYPEAWPILKEYRDNGLYISSGLDDSGNSKKFCYYDTANVTNSAEDFVASNIILALGDPSIYDPGANNGKMPENMLWDENQFRSTSHEYKPNPHSSWLNESRTSCYYVGDKYKVDYSYGDSFEEQGAHAVGSIQISDLLSNVLKINGNGASAVSVTANPTSGAKFDETEPVKILPDGTISVAVSEYVRDTVIKLEIPVKVDDNNLTDDHLNKWSNTNGNASVIIQQGDKPSTTINITSPKMHLEGTSLDTDAEGAGLVKKQVNAEGTAWAGQSGKEFSFSITPGTALYADGTKGKSPYGKNATKQDVKTKSVTMMEAGESGQQEVGFGTFYFTKPGIYTYTVEETTEETTTGTNDGWTYDKSQKTITIVVSKDAGKMTAAVQEKAPVFENAYAAKGELDTSTTIIAEKTVTAEGTAWTGENGKTFTFTISADTDTSAAYIDGTTGTAPLGNKTTADVTFKKTDNPFETTKIVDFGKITFTRAGTYTYKIKETDPTGTGNGWTYDNVEKTVKIKVTDQGNGTLKAEIASDSEKAVANNKYKADPADLDTSITAIAKKIVDAKGTAWTGENGKTFEFSITAGPATYTSGDPAEGTSPLGKNSDGAVVNSGSVTFKKTDDPFETTKIIDFGKITFTRAGTYTYNIKETTTGTEGDGWTYDNTASKAVTVEVVDNGNGTLKASVKDEKPAEFKNTYKAKGELDTEKTPLLIKKVEADGTDWAPKTFDFTIEGVNGAPLATRSNASSGEEEIKTGSVEFTASGEKEKTVSFGTIQYTEPGDYVYKVKEKEPETAKTDAWTYDLNTHEVTVKVTDDGSGKLKATVFPEAVTVTNKNEPVTINTGDETTAVLKKTVASQEDKVRETTFNFKIEAVNNAPLPKKNGQESTTGSATFTQRGTQVIDFGTITYTKVGEYHYTVTETTEVKDPWSCKQKSASVTVKVTKDGGKLVAKVDPVGVITNTYGPTIPYDTLTNADFLKRIEAPDNNWREKTFSFEIEAQDGAPLPKDRETKEDKTTASVTFAKGGEELVQNIDFGQFTFDHSGIYRYKVKEIKPDTDKGWNYDIYNNSPTEDWVYTIKVDQLADGLLYAYAISRQIVITNKYSPKGTLDTSIDAILKKTVEAEGTAWAGENGKTFTFSIKPVDEAPYPMATDSNGEAVRKTSGTVTFSEAGTKPVDFGKITFTKAGNYSYVVEEAALVGDEWRGWTCDTAAEKTVNVTVEDKGDGTLTAKVDEPVIITNTYKPEGEWKTWETAGFTKTVRTDEPSTSLKDPKAFSFTISGVDNAPLAETRDSHGDTQAWTTGIAVFEAGDFTDSNTATKTIDFGKIKFTEPGTYKYEVTETTTSGDGWVCDTEPKTVTVTVTDNGKGTLTASPTNADIINEYKPEGELNTETTAVLKKVVTADGTKWAPKTFNFTLATVSDAAEAPAEGTAPADPVKGTVTFDEAGEKTVNFGTLKYTKSGTYTYKVKEVEPKEADETWTDGLKGWTFDLAEKEFKVVVTDDGKGRLTAALNGEAAVVENKYEPYGEDDTSTETGAVLKKTVDAYGNKWADKTFTFTLATVSDADKVDPNPITGKATFSQPQETQIIDFGILSYRKAGTYRYVLQEIEPDWHTEGDGWTFDLEKKEVTIEVTDDGKGTLTAAPTLATISNAYRPTGEDDTSTEAGAVLTKTVVTEHIADGTKWTPKTFGFEITAGTATYEDGKTTGTSPAPEKSTGTATFNQAGTQIIDFGKITFHRGGTYTYKVKETKPDWHTEGDGWTLDTKEHEVKITVTDNGDGTMTVTPVKAEIENKYSPEPAVVTLEARKVLSGPAELQAEQFSFTLASGSDAEPVETVKNAADGKVTFSELSFDEVGTYEFTITEVDDREYTDFDDNRYITYNTRPIEVVVEVTDTGKGRLEATVTYDASTTVPTVENRYQNRTYDVLKYWDDADDRLETRSEELTLQITGTATVDGDEMVVYPYNDDQKNIATVSDATKWSYTFENLPKYYLGTEISYTVEETDAPEGFTLASKSDADPDDPDKTNVVLINRTDAGDLAIKKLMNVATKDEIDGEHGDTPYTFLVEVTKEDGEPLDVEAAFYTAYSKNYDEKKTEGKITGTVNFKDGKAYVDGVEGITLKANEIIRIVGLPAGATYTVTEKEGENLYTPVVFGGEGTIRKDKVSYVNFINREITKDKLKVEKVWDDEDDYDGFRPKQVSFDIYRELDGEREDKPFTTVTLDDENSFTAFIDLDKELVATISDASKSEAVKNASASYADSAAGSKSTAASFSDASVSDAFGEDGELLDGSIFNDLISVVRDAAGKVAHLFGLDDDVKVTWTAEEKEVKKDDLKYYTADDAVYEQDDTGAWTVSITNKHELMNPVWIDPPVEKIIKIKRGTITTDETFTFRMTGMNGTDLFPKGTTVKKDSDGNYYIEVSVTGEGSEEFGKIEYDKAGTYKYKITEIDGGAKYYTYSKDYYEITVEVKVEDGRLKETVTLKKNGSETISTVTTEDGVPGSKLDIAFTNEYDRTGGGGSNTPGGGGPGGPGGRTPTPSTPAEPGTPVIPEAPVPGALPKTGEPVGKAVPMLFAMLAMFGALFGFKKRDDEDEQ